MNDKKIKEAIQQYIETKSRQYVVRNRRKTRLVLA